jgi:hypothetical protein
MRTENTGALWGFARKMAELVSDLASLAGNLIKDIRDSYRPELHYMRGPGPKWAAKYQLGKSFDYEIARPSSSFELSPVYLPADRRNNRDLRGS